MLKYVIMTCSLHVHDVFNKMYVMVRMGQVKSLIIFLIKGLVFLYLSFMRASIS